MFLHDGLKKKDAEFRATNHMNMYGHSTSVVERSSTPFVTPDPYAAILRATEDDLERARR
jgi:hypothetical protein